VQKFNFTLYFWTLTPQILVGSHKRFEKCHYFYPQGKYDSVLRIFLLLPKQTRRGGGEEEEGVAE
jgi:hypothetical protein